MREKRQRGGRRKEERNHADFARLRHARERHRGFPVWAYLQPPPMLFSRDGHNVLLGDMYRGRSAFLLCSGPSLRTLDLSQLDQRGVLTLAVNNAATVYRPNLWCCVDDPGNFCDAIWYDPAILKFVPLCHMEKPFMVRDENAELVESQQVVGDMPTVFGFRRNEEFVAEQWLYEDTFNWGNHGQKYDAYNQKGSRSVMYVALRMLFYLGVRNVYLLGCDFRMTEGEANYAFEQDRSSAAISGNNHSYEILNVRLSHLEPHFREADFHVKNCTPNSGLTAFPDISFKQAIEEATELIPQRIITAGMYDRKQKQKDAQKQRRGKPASKRRGRKQDDKQQDKGDLPKAMLVTCVDEQSLVTLWHTWPTWIEFKPWLRELPLLVCHDQRLDPLRPEFDFLLKHHPVVEFAGYKHQPGRRGERRMQAERLRLLTDRVHTPWYLLLEPETIATADLDWLDPSWFEADPEGRELAYVAHSWDFSKPADTIERLDDWGDRVRGLRRHSRLDLPYEQGDARIYHETISSWLLLGNTAWTKDVADYVSNELPCASLATYFSYCAARRGDATERVFMKDYGWDHSYGRRPEKIHAMCRELIPELADVSYPTVPDLGGEVPEVIG